MNKAGKKVFFLLFLLLLAAGISCCSKEPSGKKTYKVGIVNLNKDLDKVVNGFKSRLTTLGYIDGENIKYLYNGSRRNVKELEEDLNTILNQGVDLILSVTTPASKKARMMTAGKNIPVVFAPVFDPVGSGIVESLVKPGGNMTGIKVGGGSGKALELFLRVAPDAKNILVPYSENNKATLQSLRELKSAATKLDVQLTPREVNTRQELEQILATPPPGINGIWLLNSHFLITHTKYFVNAAIKHKMPLGSSTSQVDDGVMLTYGQDPRRTGEMAADLADKIFRGSTPASLPVEQADYFLGINLVTANAIGINISNDILQVADTIIRP